MTDTTPLTPDQLAKLRKILAGATGGDWAISATAWGTTIQNDEEEMLFVERHGITYAVNPDDAALIVALVNAAPALLDMAEQGQRAKADVWDEAIDAFGRSLLGSLKDDGTRTPAVNPYRPALNGDPR